MIETGALESIVGIVLTDAQKSVRHRWIEVKEFEGKELFVSGN